MTRKEAVTFLKNKPYKFGHMLGFTDLTELHNGWIRSMLLSKDDRTLQAHRNSYKTTCVSIALALIIILLPNKRTLFCRKTDPDVKEIIKQVKNILLHPKTQYFVLCIYGRKLELTVDNSNELSTNLTTDIKGTSQLVAVGTQSSVTGKHYDFIFTDDIINIKDRMSKAEREKTKTFYTELTNVQMLGTGRIFNTGTPWHKDDAFEIMPEAEKYDCYSTGIMTEEMIADKKQKQPRSIFAANYELKHIADEDAMFTEAKFTDDATKVFNGICHIDAAYGGEDATAFTIGAHKDGYLYVYGKKYQKHVDNCLDDILTKKAMYLGGRTYTEDNADKGYLQKELKRRGDLTRTYHESMNKYIKISTYLKGIWDKVIFISDTDPSYIEEILEYNENAVHDDCPDSLSCIARLMWRQFGREEYKSIWN